MTFSAIWAQVSAGWLAMLLYHYEGSEVFLATAILWWIAAAITLGAKK